MAEPQHDYLTDVKKYAPNPDEAAVNGIVKHLGIALHSRDASYVAATDPSEVHRVRDSFLKKKLGLTQSDTELDKDLKEVLDRMHGVRDKHRVTVYYLLAEKYGKLDSFHGHK